MYTLWYLVNLLVFTQFIACRDFYLGMFRRNDFLVAQDVIYKAPAPFGYTTASYGRLFKCPITYFRVVDRLGQGRGPFTTIVRGGLRKKFISVRIKSTYRLPISVNIYVGCENKQPSTFRTTTRVLTKPPAKVSKTTPKKTIPEITTKSATGASPSTKTEPSATKTSAEEPTTTAAEEGPTTTTAEEPTTATADEPTTTAEEEPTTSAAEEPATTEEAPV